MSPIVIFACSLVGLLVVGLWWKRSLPSQALLSKYSPSDAAKLRKATISPIGSIALALAEDKAELARLRRRWLAGYIVMLAILLFCVVSLLRWNYSQRERIHEILSASGTAPAVEPFATRQRQAALGVSPTYMGSSLRGLMVDHVEVDSAWYACDLRKGDVIVEVQGVELNSPRILGDAYDALYDVGVWPIEIRVIKPTGVVAIVLSGQK